MPLAPRHSPFIDHHAPHVDTIIYTPEALGAPDVKKGCLRTVSPRRSWIKSWPGLLGASPGHGMHGARHLAVETTEAHDTA